MILYGCRSSVFFTKTRQVTGICAVKQLRRSRQKFDRCQILAANTRFDHHHYLRGTARDEIRRLEFLQDRCSLENATRKNKWNSTYHEKSYDSKPSSYNRSSPNFPFACLLLLLLLQEPVEKTQFQIRIPAIPCCISQRIETVGMKLFPSSLIPIANFTAA